MALRRLARGGARRAAPVARDDVQVRGRRPAARRRQGRDHAARRAVDAERRARTRCATSATPSTRSTAPTSPPRTSARRRATWRSSPSGPQHVSGPVARARRLGRPEPVHRARRRHGDRGLLRARLRHRRRSTGRSVAVVGLGHVGARVAELLAEAGAKLLVTDIDERKRALADGPRRALGRRPSEALDRAGRRLRAVRARRHPRPRDRPARCRRRSSPARRTTSSPTTAIADLLNARGVLWAPDFVANAGGIINIAVELEPRRLRPASAPSERVRGIGDTLRAGLRRRRARSSATPLTAAMELARRSLAEAGATARRRAAAEPIPRRAATSAARARAGPSGSSRPLDAAGQPPLLVELVEVGAERHRRGGAQAAGASSQTRSSSSSTVRSAVARAPRRSRRSRSRRWATYSVELRARVVDDRPVAGAEQRRGRASRRRAARRGTRRAPGDEDGALAEHGVAGEAHAAARRTRGGRACGRASATASQRAGRSPSRARRDAARRCRSAHRRGTASAWSAWSWVSAIPPTPPRRSASASTASTCSSSSGPGIDDPARVAPDEPRVRAGQRERPGVVGAHERDVVRARASLTARAGRPARRATAT